MKGTRVRWGVFGAGWIAQRFAMDMRYSRTGELTAVASRNPENAKRLAARHHGATVYESYEELAKSASVDAIYVATPNALHKEHCLIAIAAGKAVLCEKPFAVDTADAMEIASAAAVANVFCMEAMWTRFLPMLVKVRQQIQSGALGEISHLSASLGFARNERQGDPITDPLLGGGALNDLGCYGLSIAEYLLGPFQVTANDLERSETGCVRTAAFLLRHAGQNSCRAVSSISVSHATQLENTLCVSGSKGRLTLEAPFIQARTAKFFPVKSSTSDGQTSTFKARFISSYPGQKIKKSIRLLLPAHSALSGGFTGGGLQFEIDEVGRCLQEGRTESSLMPLGTSTSLVKELEMLHNGDAEQQ